VCDNTSTSVVKPLVLDLHHSMNLDVVRLERKRNLDETGEKISLQKKAFTKELRRSYMYVVVSKVRPERRMEVDVHLPTNLLQPMGHLLCFKNQCSQFIPETGNFSAHTCAVRNSYLPSIIWWYSSVFSVFGVRCAASLALATLERKWGPSDDTGEQYSTFTMCL